MKKENNKIGRPAEFYIILGTNGTGKTSFLRKLSKIAKRTLIVTPDYIEWTDIPEITINELKTFKGIARIVYEKNVLLPIHENFRNGLLLLDDYRDFRIKANSQESDIIRSLIVRRRQKMRDIAVCVHGFSEVTPKFLFTYPTHYVLFKTLDSITVAKEYIRTNTIFEFLKNKQSYINSKFDNNKRTDFMTYHEIIKL